MNDGSPTTPSGGCHGAMLSLTLVIRSGANVIESGTTIGGRYDVVCKVGGGHYGEVFKARVRDADQTVAIKFQARRSLESTAEFDFLGRDLAGELICMQRLHGIHGVPALYGKGGAHEGRQYFVMDYIDGKPLSRLADSVRPVSTQFAAAVMAQLCTIVEKVHRRGLLHGDIKPDNVVVRQDGSVWLLDFGSAIDVDDSDAGVYGTPGYTPPEHFTGARPTSRWDVYALGATLFEMCVLHVPYARHDGRPRRETQPFHGIPLENMDDTLRDLGRRMVAFDPERRPEPAAILATLAPQLPRSGDRRDPLAPHPDPAEWYRYGRHLRHRAS